MLGSLRIIAVGLIASFLFVMGAHALSAPLRMSVIVERKPDYIEVFVGMPATGLKQIFALPEHSLAAADGTVDFESLRSGTWDIGDDAFDTVDARLGGRAVNFEAMSVMLHPIAERVPFRTAVDATLAVSICQVDTPPVRPTLSELYAYAGFISLQNDTKQPLTLTFSETDRLPWLVDVKIYDDGKLVETSWNVLRDGGSLSL
ncbi:MAG: hypothetical protein AAF764_09480 [Pseudomonadota bacterium]